MPNTRKPGRPPGSSRLNGEDEIALQRIANRMISVPGSKVTPVMLALGIADETTQRRLRRKWKPVADRYVREAVARRDAEVIEARRETMRQMGEGLRRFAIAFQETRGNVITSFNRWAAENPDLIEGVRNAAKRMQMLQDHHRV